MIYFLKGFLCFCRWLYVQLYNFSIKWIQWVISKNMIYKVRKGKEKELEQREFGVDVLRYIGYICEMI